MEDENNIPDTTINVLKGIMESFALDKAYMLMFITEQGLTGEYVKYIQTKQIEFEKGGISG